jgi:hypothetical protein
LRSSEVSQETISFGSCCIFKPNGTWSGKEEESKLDNVSGVMWKSLDRESDTEFSSPGNH